MASAPSSESVTEHSNFEAMFSRALQPDAAFKAELRAAGFDLDAPKPRYPTPVWHACLEIARRRTFPDLPPEQGFHRLGLLYMQGLWQTILGKMFSAAMPLLGLDRSMARVPKMWKASQPNMDITTTKIADGDWRVTLREEGMLADFCAGLLEGGAAPVGVDVKATVLERSHNHCVIAIKGLGNRRK